METPGGAQGRGFGSKRKAPTLNLLVSSFFVFIVSIVIKQCSRDGTNRDRVGVMAKCQFGLAPLF